MNRETGETLLGAIVIVIAAMFLLFATGQGDDSSAGADASPAFAHFNRVDGIAKGADVRMAGVKIGIVTDVSLTPENAARLDFALSPQYRIPIDSVARIQTDGLLGGAYVAIEPGPGLALEEGGPTVLAANGELMNTSGSVDLATTLGGLVNSVQATLDEVARDRNAADGEQP